MPSQKPVIFFHVGLGKTASTYLQHKVFPKFRDIQYIPTNQYKKSLAIIEKGKADKYLVSREFDRQFKDEVSKFTSVHPDAYIICVFRRHDKWIASQYKRHVKGGFYKELKDFLDIEENKGFWDRKELIFMDKIKTIEQYSSQKPLILFHEDMARDPIAFIEKIATYCGASIDIEAISLRPKHTAWSDKQLLAVKSFRKHVTTRDIKGGRNRWETWVYYRPWWLLFHVVMYLSILIPKKWLSKASLINPEELEAIRSYMTEDWEALQSYAKKLETSS